VLVCASRAFATGECSTTIGFKEETSVALRGVTRTENHLSVFVRINGTKEDLAFIFDTGAGRTILDRRIAGRLGLKATEKSSIGGVGKGRVDVDVVKHVSLQLGDLRLNGVDLNLVDDVHEPNAAGIIGYDLLCATVVTVDYKKPEIVVTAPERFQYHGRGDVLPLTFKGRWSCVRGTLKVPGVDPVSDDFVIDTGSEDAVNHPIIRQSKGELRAVNTGAGGFGQGVPGVIGSNEWFRIGSATIPSTTSVCCAGNEDVNRQLGGAILSQFRIIFNYPESKVIFEKY
jgi:predicted aspartyl protease